MDRYKNIRGLAGTIIFHGVILVIFLIFSFSAPFPPPEEEGIIVNFGTNEQGFGSVEPQRQQYTPPIVEEEQQEEQEAVIPPVIPEIEAVEIPDESESEAQDLLTQELEEAARINAQKNKEEEAEKKRLDELERQRLDEIEKARLAEVEKQRIEDDRVRQAELERQRIETERLRQEELERQKIAEEERQRKAEQLRKQQQRSDISNRMQKSFGGAGESDTNASEGLREGVGNQGIKTGSVESDDRTMIHSTGSGISYSLEGRNVVGALKRPQYPGQESGTVVVSISVNKEGRVVSAVPGVRGSTTMDSKLLEAAKKVAMSARFNKVTDPSAAITQKGTISYIFKLTGG
ncbi:MAG: TonB family protein [Bacteroidetes bacterium]|nr:TonB family protein [Bacteroidota bacterium]